MNFLRRRAGPTLILFIFKEFSWACHIVPMNGNNHNDVIRRYEADPRRRGIFDSLHFFFCDEEPLLFFYSCCTVHVFMGASVYSNSEAWRFLHMILSICDSYPSACCISVGTYFTKIYASNPTMCASLKALISSRVL